MGKVYLSGPISAATEEGVQANKARMRSAEAALQAAGFTVVCPLDNGLHESAKWEEHMRAVDRPGYRLPDEGNPVVSCGCGCGAHFQKFDRDGRPRMFCNGHHLRKHMRALHGDARQARGAR